MTSVLAMRPAQRTLALPTNGLVTTARKGTPPCRSPPNRLCTHSLLKNFYFILSTFLSRFISQSQAFNNFGNVSGILGRDFSHCDARLGPIATVALGLTSWGQDGKKRFHTWISTCNAFPPGNVANTRAVDIVIEVAREARSFRTIQRLKDPSDQSGLKKQVIHLVRPFPVLHTRSRGSLLTISFVYSSAKKCSTQGAAFARYV